MYKLRWYRDKNRPYEGDFFIFGGDLLEEVLLFLMCYILVFVIYQLFIVRKGKKNGKEGKLPTEIKYLLSVYKIDLDKVPYNRLLQLVALISSFDISLIVTIVFMFDKYWLQLLVAIVLSIPTIFLSYHIVGNHYKKGGKIKDE